MIANLVADHEAVVRTSAVDLATAMEKLGDAGTSDFLTGLLEKHERGLDAPVQTANSRRRALPSARQAAERRGPGEPREDPLRRSFAPSLL